MPVYTVHEPPALDDDALAHAERFVLVRDGFHFWAFLLGPVWMLRYRLWLALLGYLVLSIGGGVLLYMLDASGITAAVAGFLLSLLVGLEAASLRRSKLARRGWTNLGVVVGDDREAAERRFFDAWVTGSSAPATPPAMPPPQAGLPARRAAGASDVIGLFPEPGGRG